jgi:glycerophosphoryl diester phosphodiesterase
MKIYAHRGYSEKFPEGSKIAYLEAVKAGADGFECDVRLTKDREVVCCHDRSLRRIAGKNIVISQSTLAELKEHIDILTLSELLDIAILHRKDLLIETKHPVASAGAIEKSVVELLSSRANEIKDSGIEIIVMSFSYMAVKRLRMNYPLVGKVIKYRLPLYLNRNPIIAVNKNLVLRGKSKVREIRANRILLWTINELPKLEYIKSHQQFDVITDRVGLAQKILSH